MNTTIVDSHAHLGWDSFAEDRNEVIKRAQESGVVQIVQAAVELDRVPESLKLAEEFPFIFNGVGLHPHEANVWKDSDRERVIELCAHKSVVAIGECGLDFFYNHSDRESQISCFKAQIELSMALDLPIIVHTRDAWDETFELLEAEGKGKLRGVFHCFTGKPEYLPRIANLDFYLSFSGILTFQNAREIQATAAIAPKERILVETDCPYLAPQGHRGKRNEPSFIWKTAERLAELRHSPLEEIAAITAENCRRLFLLPKP